tara:strand:+ start:93 stop:1436 length:1344 start_codon:yes stop_codon:yes gene_type:complete
VDTFYYTGSTQILTLSSSCSSDVTFDVRGAKGGDQSSALGGSGGRIQGTINFNVGDVLYINVGQAGLDDQSSSGGVFVGSGGVYSYSTNPAGSSGTGGGASDIRLNGTTLADRIIVGGGGGGAGGNAGQALAGGAGGGLIGGTGVPWNSWPNAGGQGGTQLVGGTMGIACCDCPLYTTDGSFGIGGEGSGDAAGGGGGGGGYYGGGGACFSGGGGGSNYIDPLATSVVNTQGYQSSDGMIILTYFAGANQTVFACDSFVSPSGNYTWYTSGIYNDTILSFSGCTDTNLVIDLTINGYSSTQTQESCTFYVWPQTGDFYTTSGIYSDTLSTFLGCDSILFLDLTILPGSLSVDSVTTCETYTWPVNGVVYTSDISIIESLIGANGCDSSINLVLDIRGGQSTLETVTACNSYFWPLTNQVLTNTGSYTANFIDTDGCDSIVTLHLSVS